MRHQRSPDCVGNLPSAGLGTLPVAVHCLVAAGGGPEDIDVATLGAGAAVLVAVRPTSIAVHTREPEHASVRNVWAGRVVGMDLLADRVRLSVDGEIDAAVDITAAAMTDLGLAEGAPVWLSVKATDVVAYAAP